MDMKIKGEHVQEMLSKDPGWDRCTLGRTSHTAHWKLRRSLCAQKLMPQGFTEDYEMAIRVSSFFHPLKYLRCNASQEDKGSLNAFKCVYPDKYHPGT